MAAAATPTPTTRRTQARPYRAMSRIGGGPEELAQDPAQSYTPFDPNGGMPDTSGFNLYPESAARTPLSTLQGSSVPFYSGDDIAKQYTNNRNTQQNIGDRYEGYFG